MSDRKSQKEQMPEEKPISAELLSAEQKYKTLFDSIDEGFCIIEVLFDEKGVAYDYRFLETNAAFEKQTGLVNVIGKTIKEITDNHEKYWFEIYGEIAKTGVAQRFENVANALGRYYEVYAFRIGSEEPGQVAVLFNDISKRKKAEEDLQKSKEAIAQDLRNTQLLQNLSERLVSENNLEVFYQEIVHAAIALTNADAGTIQRLDEEAKELVMLTSEGFEKHVTDHFHRVNAGSNTSCGIALQNSERTYIDYDDPNAEDPDGSLKMYLDAGYLSAQSTPLVTRTGKPVGMISTHWRKHRHRPSESELRFLDLLARQVSDLLERKQREDQYLLQLENEVRQRTAELNRQKDFIETVINATPDLVGVYDTETRFLMFNKSCETYFKISQEEVLGKRLLDVFPAAKGGKAEQDLLRALSGGLVHNHQFHSVAAGRDYENYIIPLKDREGKVYAALVIAHDITEKNQYARELEIKNHELEKMNKELEAFAYVSSHDLQEPLRKIQTFSGLIMEKEEQVLSATGKEYFTRIQHAASRMQILIQDLLSFSRLATTERRFETVPLSQILDEVVADFSEAIKTKNAKIEVSNSCEVKVIPFQFRQLLHNLVSNSLKFAKSETAPHISINAQVVPREEAFPTGEKKACHICYTDNGIGFEQHFADKIFGLFQRLHSKYEFAGTGIGLAIVKKIIENHNGMITATGEPDKGARFDIYLPMGEA